MEVEKSDELSNDFILRCTFASIQIEILYKTV